MRFVIVTGMSGAGKSTTLKTLEDIGYFCVDNLPIQLIMRFAEIAYAKDNDINNVAIGVDIRSGVYLEQLSECLEQLKASQYNYEILFLDSNDDVLIKRYKETRRNHPLARNGRVEDGIKMERSRIAFLRKEADYIIDTTSLLTRELKAELDKIFIENAEYNNFIINIVSFGFKYGIPRDADLVFDVRFLPNPYYDLELRPLTGNDEAIQNFVMQFDEAKEFMNKIVDLLEFLIPNYIKEGKNGLVVAVGCTGGKHRSVTLANGIFKELESLPYSVRIVHRDIEKDAIRKG
ncbi:MAG: RNase adapter RapZ [Lachnospiraceae bacterium]|nr:RNase adapter RapZ [Lachnospiraceae bacterium]HCJ07008.1 RNase adapter RapZ [Lachnospiraceae bacterium]